MQIQCEVLQKQLQRVHSAFQVFCFEELSSTNDYAKNLSNDSPALIIAKRQTAGRGRNEKRFSSPHGGIYFTLYYPNHFTDCSFMTIVVAVALLQCFKSESKQKYTVKWVNDIYLHSKKVCGILCENQFTPSENHSLIGIGINLPESVASELPEIAAKTDIQDVQRFLYRLIRKLLRDLPKLDNAAFRAKILRYYTRHCFILGKTIDFMKNDTRQTAKAVALSPSGALIIEYPDGTIDTLQAGEISVKLTN